MLDLVVRLVCDESCLELLGRLGIQGERIEPLRRRVLPDKAIRGGPEREAIGVVRPLAPGGTAEEARANDGLAEAC